MENIEKKGRMFNPEQASLKASAFAAKVFAVLAVMSLTVMALTIHILKDSVILAIIGASPMLFLATMCISETVYNIKSYKKSLRT